MYTNIIKTHTIKKQVFLDIEIFTNTNTASLKNNCFWLFLLIVLKMGELL